jgi:hypothetical protein
MDPEIYNHWLVSGFASAMDKEIKSNEPRKGPYQLWQPSPDEVLSELRHHLEKLDREVGAKIRHDGRRSRAVGEYLADIAVICAKAYEMYGPEMTHLPRNVRYIP